MRRERGLKRHERPAHGSTDARAVDEETDEVYRREFEQGGFEPGGSGQGGSGQGSSGQGVPRPSYTDGV